MPLAAHVEAVYGCVENDVLASPQVLSAIRAAFPGARHFVLGSASIISTKPGTQPQFPRHATWNAELFGIVQLLPNQAPMRGLRRHEAVPVRAGVGMQQVGANIW